MIKKKTDLRTRTKTGLDILSNKIPPFLKKAKIGIICNQSSVNSNLMHITDIFSISNIINVKAIFGPQHGVKGEKQANMIESKDHFDKRLNSPVYSLYSDKRKPTQEMLKGLDALIFDIQDVGARYYTFIYTMAFAMEAAAEAGIDFVVLDRPNPIGGLQVEGNPGDDEYKSFVGVYDLPPRHGMTVGEIAYYINNEFKIHANLFVVKMKNWERDMYFEDTLLPWIPPSPNMPTIDTAVVYPGMCIFEGTNLSEGRGNTKPFEFFGAPYIKDAENFARQLNTHNLPGVFFREAYYQPTFDKWKGEVVAGAQIHVLDRTKFKPYLSAIGILKTSLEYKKAGFKYLPPPYEYEYKKQPIDILLRDIKLRKMIEAGKSLKEIEKSWQADLKKFINKRKDYLLY